mmetsp:Transcript_16273/g.38852  ORF Transcript_16273/g.38852 Transcript_16273/m.38852 type:complete len:238 (-) Transcript_16273:406-1119(-)
MLTKRDPSLVTTPCRSALARAFAAVAAITRASLSRAFTRTFSAATAFATAMASKRAFAAAADFASAFLRCISAFTLPFSFISCIFANCFSLARRSFSAAASPETRAFSAATRALFIAFSSAIRALLVAFSSASRSFSVAALAACRFLVSVLCSAAVWVPPCTLCPPASASPTSPSDGTFHCGISSGGGSSGTTFHSGIRPGGGSLRSSRLADFSAAPSNGRRDGPVCSRNSRSSCKG